MVLNLEEMENFVNSLSTMTVGLLLHSKNLDASSLYNQQLKSLINQLKKHDIVYSKQQELDRLNDLIVASTHPQQTKKKQDLSKTPFHFNGKLVKEEPNVVFLQQQGQGGGGGGQLALLQGEEKRKEGQDGGEKKKQQQGQGGGEKKKQQGQGGGEKKKQQDQGGGGGQLALLQGGG
jgi:hypothetical protein